MNFFDALNELKTRILNFRNDLNTRNKLITKKSIKQKKLFIHMKGDLIDVKYEIDTNIDNNMIYKYYWRIGVEK